MLFTTRRAARLSGALALLTIITCFRLFPSTIMLDLPLKRALIAVQPMPWHERPHSFSWAPFGRFITVRHEAAKEKDLLVGVLVDYRYRIPGTSWWADIATALAGERLHPRLHKGQERRKRVGFDDITLQLGCDIIRERTAIISPYLIAALGTTHPSANGVLVGTGNNVLGAGFDASYAFSRPAPDHELQALVSAMVVHSFKRTVELNRKFEELHVAPTASNPARYTDRFDIGNGFFGILGLRYEAPWFGIELGYNPAVLFGTNEDITPLTRHHQGLFKFRCEHERTALLSQVTTPILRDDVKKPFVMHGFYAQAQSMLSAGEYDVAVLAGLSHDFSQDHIIKRWTGWVSLAVQF